MKNKILTLCALTGLVIFAGCFAGCTTTRLDAAGVPVKTFDPVKTEQVKAAVVPVVSSVVRRVLNNSPEHAEEIASYLRAVGGVFCEASASGRLGPETVLGALDAATLHLQSDLDEEIIDGKNLLLALYRINYADRFSAELPPDQWPKNIADVICAAIDQGLKDARQPGVR